MTKENKSTSAKEFVSCLLLYSTRLILDDYFWQLFGYKKTPRRGSWFNKFINKYRRNQEVFLLRELLIVSICLSVKSFYNLSNELQYKILHNMLENLLPKTGVAGAFCFNTLGEAYQYFEDGIYEYLDTDTEHFQILFMARGTKILNDNFNSGWIVGMIRMQTDMNLPNILKDKFDMPLIDDIE